MSFEFGERLNARNWDEFLRKDPELARIEIGIARSGRVLAVDHPSSPQFAEAQAMDRRLRDERRELWERRANGGAPF